MREKSARAGAYRRATPPRWALLTGFRNARRVLEEFRPPICVIWATTIREFKEENQPAVLRAAGIADVTKTWQYIAAPNRVPRTTQTEKTFNYEGHRAAGNSSQRHGSRPQGFDVSYGLQAWHHRRPDFLEYAGFLDVRPQRLPYPVVRSGELIRQPASRAAGRLRAG